MCAKRKHHADLLLVIALFAVYAISAIMLCAIGAGVYRNITAVMTDDYDTRTGVLYVAEKVRQNEVGGAVRTDKLDGSDALVLVEQETGREYETWIYIADGNLCEQMIAKGAQVDVPSGQVIMPMKTMELSLSKARLLTVTMTTQSDVQTAISLNIKVGDEAFYAGKPPEPLGDGSEDVDISEDFDDTDDTPTITLGAAEAIANMPGGEE